MIKHFGCQLKLKHRLVYYRKERKEKKNPLNDDFHLASLSPNKYQIISLLYYKAIEINKHSFFYNSRFGHI